MDDTERLSKQGEGVGLEAPLSCGQGWADGPVERPTLRVPVLF